MGIRRLISQIKKFFFWGWKLKDSEDRDYSSIYDMLNLKVNRMIQLFEKDKEHDLKKEIKILKIIRELTKRLSKQDYINNLLKEHEAKWGKSYFKSIGELPPYGVCYRTSFENCTPKNERQALREYTIVCSKVFKIEKNDKELLFKLINKHINRWLC